MALIGTGKPAVHCKLWAAPNVIHAGAPVTSHVNVLTKEKGKAKARARASSLPKASRANEHPGFPARERARDLARATRRARAKVMVPQLDAGYAVGHIMLRNALRGRHGPLGLSPIGGLKKNVSGK